MTAEPSAPLVVLPRFSLLKAQPDPPHVARTLLEREWPNEHDVPRRYVVKESRRGGTWWIYATTGGTESRFRVSDTVRTTVRKKADLWLEAVRTGRITVG